MKRTIIECRRYRQQESRHDHFRQETPGWRKCPLSRRAFLASTANKVGG
jgi:hypothetical protein